MSSEYHFAEWYLLAAAGFTRSRGPPKFFRGRPGSFRPPSCVMRTSRSTAPTVCAHAPICEQRLPLCKKLPQSHTKHPESSSSPLSAPAMPLSCVSVRMNGLASLRATGRAVTRWQLCVFARIFFSTSSVAPFGRTSEPSMDLRKFIARVRVMSLMSPHLVRFDFGRRGHARELARFGLRAVRPIHVSERGVYEFGSFPLR
mmetsp:Transcript_41738/g.102977  ORF Transcript_41738/g.102977 Transcript_41738/m.102977 type:complete len:201 (-) Transcript_41738:589-1191(-)